MGFLLGGTKCAKIDRVMTVQPCEYIFKIALYTHFTLYIGALYQFVYIGELCGK